MEATTRLYGRDREIRLLHNHLDVLFNGRGGLVLIGGEAGIGKSALVAEILDTAQVCGAQVYVGACYDLEATPPYGPWRDAGWQSAANSFGQSVPVVLRQDITDESSPVLRVAQTQIIEFLRTLSEDSPLVLILEDLHWSERASLDLLRAVSRNAGAMRLLIIATYRDDEIGIDHDLFELLPVLVRESRAQQINLRRLTSQDVADLLRDRVQLADDDHRRLVQFLYRSSDGNPLFLHEVLRALEEERRLERRDGEWHLDELVARPVRGLIRGIIERRLQRFDASERALLAIASVIGRDVEFDLWCATADVEPRTISALSAKATAAHGSINGRRHAPLQPRPDP